MSERVSKTYRVFILLLILVMSLSAIYLWQVYEQRESETNEDVKPKVLTIEQKVSIVGQITPREKVKIKSQANGVLEEIHVRPGQYVHAGDLIARIGLRSDPVEINTVSSQISKAQLEANNSKKELARQQTLFDKRLIPLTQLQEFQLKHDLAQQTLTQAKQELELKTKGATPHINNTSTLIRATIDGVVLERPVEIGTFIIKMNDLSEGTTIATIADMKDLIFKGEIDEVDVGRIKEDMTLYLRVGALPDQVFQLKIESISPEARRTEQGRVVFDVIASIPSPESKLMRAGFSATAEVVYGKRENIIAIEESYLIFENHQAFLLVRDKTEHVIKTPVSLGISDGFYVEIRSGINLQDQIINPTNDK